VSTLLHPADTDPNLPRAAFAEYAADSLWVWSHLGQFVGVAVLGVALVMLADTLSSGRARPWARIGLFGTAASVAVAAALQAVDGVALKVMVDRWAAATGEGRALAFEAALAVRQIEIGLASLFSLLIGLTVMVFALAIIRSARYPSWLGPMGLLGGLGLIATGGAQGHRLLRSVHDPEHGGGRSAPRLGRLGRRVHVAAGTAGWRLTSDCRRNIARARAALGLVLNRDMRREGAGIRREEPESDRPGRKKDGPDLRFLWSAVYSLAFWLLIKGGKVEQWEKGALESA
jgi:hypothetical protein